MRKLWPKRYHGTNSLWQFRSEIIYFRSETEPETKLHIYFGPKCFYFGPKIMLVIFCFERLFLENFGYFCSRSVLGVFMHLGINIHLKSTQELSSLRGKLGLELEEVSWKLEEEDIPGIEEFSRLLGFGFNFFLFLLVLCFLWTWNCL